MNCAVGGTSIPGGTSDANVSFNDLRKLLEGLEFNERIKGSRHIFTQEGSWTS